MVNKLALALLGAGIVGTGGILAWKALNAQAQTVVGSFSRSNQVGVFDPSGLIVAVLLVDPRDLVGIWSSEYDDEDPSFIVTGSSPKLVGQRGIDLGIRGKAIITDLSITLGSLLVFTDSIPGNYNYSWTIQLFDNRVGSPSIPLTKELTIYSTTAPALSSAGWQVLGARGYANIGDVMIQSSLTTVDRSGFHYPPQATKGAPFITVSGYSSGPTANAKSGIGFVWNHELYGAKVDETWLEIA